MQDLISRQVVIDAFYKYPNIDWTTLDVLAKINALPSAQPEKVDTPTVDTSTVDTPNCDDTISRQAAIDSICRTVCDNPEICESPCDEIKVLEIMPSAQPDKDMIHLQKEQAYMQGWEEGRKALREEIWENGRDRLD